MDARDRAAGDDRHARLCLPVDLVSGIQQQESDGAHVFSASWGYRGKPAARFERWLFNAVARVCHASSVVCTFPSGDHGPPGDRPSNSPYVLAVGGTVFTPQPDGSVAAEEPWPFGGFGVTRFPEQRPNWQRLRCGRSSCVHRVVPDVSATAAGVGEYEIGLGKRDHHPAGWFLGGGTSLSSPLWAALIAIADQQLGLDGQPAIGIGELHAVLYRGWVSAGLDDMGHSGWSRRTGWGAPKAGIVDVLVKAIERYRKQR